MLLARRQCSRIARAVALTYFLARRVLGKPRNRMLAAGIVGLLLGQLCPTLPPKWSEWCERCAHALERLFPLP